MTKVKESTSNRLSEQLYKKTSERLTETKTKVDKNSVAYESTMSYESNRYLFIGLMFISFDIFEFCFITFWILL